MINFLLGRNWVIPKNEHRYILYTGMSTFPYGIGPPWLRGRDRHIILVFTWEDKMEDWGIDMNKDDYKDCDLFKVYVLHKK